MCDTEEPREKRVGLWMINKSRIESPVEEVLREELWVSDVRMSE